MDEQLFIDEQFAHYNPILEKSKGSIINEDAHLKIKAYVKYLEQRENNLNGNFKINLTMNDVLLTPIRLNEFETLIQNSVERAIKALISQQTGQTILPDKLLTTHEAAELLHLTVPTLYSKVCKGELPSMKQGKRLYFSQKELVEYVKQGRKKATGEI